MASVKFDITGDASGVVNATRQAEMAFGKLSKTATKEGHVIDGMFKQIAQAGALIGVGFGAQKLISDIIKVRGEFQQLGIAFETMLGSEEKANELMSQLTQTAAKTPFGLTEVANGAKQLLAYGTASEEVNETLVRLGNIASGLSIPLNDLVYLFGTTQTQGQLFTQDLRQFMGRGIPLADELAKKFGVTKNEVSELVSKGKVGFEDMRDALWSMTNEGGKFYNLMEKQSASVTGQISNLGDAFDMMLNEIGESSEGLIYGTVSVLTYLVENYEKVGRILLGIAGTYGTYRAAIILATAAEKIQAVQRLAHIKGMKTQALVTELLKKKTQSLANAMKLSPFTLIATAIAAVVAVVWNLVEAESAAEKAQEAANEQAEEEKRLYDERITKANQMIETINDETSALTQKIAAMQMLKSEYPKIFENYDIENLKLADIAEIQRQINEENQKRRSNDLISKARTNWKSMIDMETWHKNASGASRLVMSIGRDYYQDYEKDKANFNRAIDDWIKEIYLPALQLKVEKESVEELQKRIETYKRNERTPYGVRRGLVGTFGLGIGYLGHGGHGLSMTNNEGEWKNLFPTEYEDDVLEIYESVLRSKLPKATKPEDMYGFQYREAEQAWKDAVKALEEVKKAKDKFTKEEYKARVENEKNTREAFEALGGETKEGKKKEDEVKKANDSYNKTLRKAEKERERLIVDIQNDVEQAEINAMDEGAEKTRRQRDLNHKKEIEQIERQKEDYIDAAVNRDKELFEAQEKLKAASDKNYVEGTFDENASRKKHEQSDQAKAYDSIKEQTRLKQEVAAINELKKKYEDYASGIKRINGELEADLSQMRDADGGLLNGFTQEQVDIAIKKAEEAKDALALSYAEQSTDFDAFIASLANKTSFELTKMLAEAEMALALLEDDGETDQNELARARAEVAKLKEQLRGLQIDANVKNASVSWSDLNNVLSDAASKFTELGNIVPGVTGQMLSGIGTLAASAVGVANGVKAIKDAKTALEKASAVLAIASTVIKVIQTITSAVKENDEANQAVIKSTNEYKRALENLDIEKLRDKSNSVFGEDSLGLFKTNLSIAKEQIVGLSDELANIKVFDSSDLFNLTQKSSGFSNFSKSFRNKIKEINRAGNMALVSDMRTGWQRFWGSGNDNIKVANLEDFIDSEGMLDNKRLREWYKAYGDGLSTEQKNTIDELLAGWDSYYESLEEMESYVEGLLGNTIDDIAEKWITAFDETGNAMTDLKEISNDFAKSFAKDMLKNMLATEVFNQANTDTLLELIKSGDFDAATAFYEDLVNQAERLGNSATSILTTYGVESAKESNRSSSDKGTVQASQDSINEVMGIATNIQSHTYSINQHMLSIVGLSKQILLNVQHIKVDTSRLAMVENYLMYMSSDISDIRNRGVIAR